MYESDRRTISEAELCVFKDTVIDHTQKRKEKHRQARPKVERQERNAAKLNRKKRRGS